MAIIKKISVFGLIPAIAFCVALVPQPVSAAESGAIVVKEKSIASDTIVNPNMSSPSDGQVTPERPFRGHREMRPAGTAVVGEEMNAGNPVLDVVNYASSISSRMPNELVLNTTISQPEDDATLSRVAAKIYRENGGQNYDNVTIFWHVGNNPQSSSPWGRTDIRKGDTVYEVIRLQQ